MGDAVGLVLQFGVGPAQAFCHAQPVATPFFHMAVQQLGRAVQALGKLQLGQFEHVLGLQLGGRQVIKSKGVDMGGIGHGWLS